MSLVSFKLLSDPYSIEISGSDFNYNSLKSFYKVLQNLNKKDNLQNVKIIGNFNTKLLVKDIFNKRKQIEIDKLLLLLQAITKTIEDSNIIFSAVIKGVAKGPTLEIALACNFIKAKEDVILNLNFVDNGYIPFFGTIQRLLRILGYKKTLQVLLVDKIINFEEADNMKIVNNKSDHITRRNSPLWDNTFTNTFIFFNSKIHSAYKKCKPEYNVMLSIIFESSVCNYESGLSIEKRWLKWLLLSKL